MADRNKEKAARLLRRRRSIRSNLMGTAERPRLSVYRSSRHIYAQVIDDMSGRTLASAGTLGKSAITGEGGKTADASAAAAVGRAIAEKATAAGVSKVCFDRAGRRYHGRVKALADAARKGGLEF